MTPVVLHVGAMKTGSSALQRAFTVQPVRRARHGSSAETFEYVGLVPWELLRGRGILEASLRNGDCYERSSALDAIVREAPERRSKPLGKLRQMREAGIVPILSNEMWLHESDLVHSFAALLDAPLHVVAYISPQAPWLNSLFWQRYSLRSRSLDAWLSRAMVNADWARQLAVWRSAPGVERVSIRLKCADIVPDFCGALGCEDGGGGVQWNSSFPGAFARYIDRWNLPELFAATAVKQVFARWLSACDPSGAALPSLGRTPVVIGPSEIARIVDFFREGNRQVLEWCEPEVASQIRNDPRWWSTDPRDHATKDFDFVPTPAMPPDFVGRRIEPGDESYRKLLLETDLLLQSALAALVKADEAWRDLERARTSGLPPES